MNYVRMRAFFHVAETLRGSAFSAIGGSRLFFAVLIAQLLFLSAQHAHGTDLPKPMSVVTLPGYEIYSSVSERRTCDVLNELSSYHQLMEVAMKHKALPEAIPTRILLLSRADWRRYFGVRKDLAGLFAPYSFCELPPDRRGKLARPVHADDLP